MKNWLLLLAIVTTLAALAAEEKPVSMSGIYPHLAM